MCEFTVRGTLSLILITIVTYLASMATLLSILWVDPSLSPFGPVGGASGGQGSGLRQGKGQEQTGEGGPVADKLRGAGEPWEKVFDTAIKGEIIKFREERYLGYAEAEGGRRGPGEQGEAVLLHDPRERHMAHQHTLKEGFNLLLSDKISLQRSLTDVRHDSCQSATYPHNLPTLSVIFIFANEAPSLLLRSVHGVIHRTPPHLLHEVILVDDASDKVGLGPELDQYISLTWPDRIVKVIRLKTRSGLIRARLAGARAATGDVIAIMDGHVEVNRGWAEPLLARLQADPRLLVTPAVDAIDPNTFAYSSGKASLTVTFRWDMHYMWLPYELKDPLTPIPAADMVGCAFAMDRRMFFELGSFDEDMEVWGCENTEICFRMWMCASGVEIIPCSRVAHLFRTNRPYKVPADDYYGFNSQRVAEVWLGDYKKYYYYLKPDRMNASFGDISGRQRLKEKLGCKDFDWFLSNFKPTPFLYDRDVQAWGRVQNIASKLCLDTFTTTEQNAYPLMLYPCNYQYPTHAQQLFALSDSKLLRREFVCAIYPGWEEKEQGRDITMVPCVGGHPPNQTWSYNTDTSELVHELSGWCMDGLGHKRIKAPTLAPCAGQPSQRWTIEHMVTT